VRAVVDGIQYLEFSPSLGKVKGDGVHDDFSFRFLQMEVPLSLKTCGFSDILFALKLPKAISLGGSRI
ncbi:MAG: hypothetical protein IIX77_02280, partial [Oscillospiraceae bacterium]|nr:hypothetical protein [Oscillospiraceae bacterium]